MTDFSQEQMPGLVQTTPKDWLVAYGTTLLVLFFFGILPRLFW
jgi:hypothetical protein